MLRKYKLYKLGYNTEKLQVFDVLDMYFQELYKDSNLPVKIGFTFERGNFTICVFAITKDDDEDANRNIIMSEASVNGVYYNKGFLIESTWVEESDNYDIPSVYEIFKL